MVHRIQNLIMTMTILPVTTLISAIKIVLRVGENN